MTSSDDNVGLVKIEKNYQIDDNLVVIEDVTQVILKINFIKKLIFFTFF
jgi:hypothetical protein